MNIYPYDTDQIVDILLREKFHCTLVLVLSSGACVDCKREFRVNEVVLKHTHDLQIRCIDCFKVDL